MQNGAFPFSALNVTKWKKSRHIYTFWMDIEKNTNRSVTTRKGGYTNMDCGIILAIALNQRLVFINDFDFVLSPLFLSPQQLLNITKLKNYKEYFK